MQPSQEASANAGAWFVEADRTRTRARFDENRVTSAHAVIASSLFLVLFALALMLGGHAALDPLLQSAIAAHQPRGPGQLVVALPDGVYCRKMSFDNATAEIVEGAIQRCPDGMTWERS